MLKCFLFQGKFNSNFRTSNVILHNDAVPLNPDHTHFIFVDDGYRIRYGGVAGVRARFEQKISQPQAGTVYNTSRYLDIQKFLQSL